MNWLFYIAEANLYLGVFYLAYCIFLSKETHYQFNRAYLLTACVLSFVIPLVQLGFLMPVQYLALNDSMAPAPPAFTWWHALLYLYIIGVVFFAARFGLKLYQLNKLVRDNTVVPADSYKIVSLPDTDTAFSFFNYLFIGTLTDDAAIITRHELVHIRQRHSVDIVFVELLQIVSWFNPAIYLLQNSLKTVHEYVADEQTTRSETDIIAYATYLLNNAYGLSGPAMTHSFFNYNLLKKRITMLHQKRSGNLARLKYLIAAPLCMGLLYQSTFGFDKTYGLINIAPKTPVIVQADVADTVPNKKTAPVNVEPLLKEKVKGLTIQNSTKLKPTGTIISDGKTSEQVFVEDKSGKLIDFYSEEGKKIHADNLAREKAKGYQLRKKENKTTDEASVPAANVEQLLDGKVRGVVIRTKEPKTGSSTTIEEGNIVGDALYREPKVRGLNIQNNTTAAIGTEVRIEEPQQQAEIRIEEPVTTKQKPQQQKVPSAPPLQKGKKEMFDPNVPKPDISKVRFPPPVVRPDKHTKATKAVRFPPPIVVKDKPAKKADDVRFPPPIAKPDKPAKKVVKFPPPVVKPDPAKSK